MTIEFRPRSANYTGQRRFENDTTISSAYLATESLEKGTLPENHRLPSTKLNYSWRYIVDIKVMPDRIVCSTVKRTNQTTSPTVSATSNPPHEVQFFIRNDDFAYYGLKVAIPFTEGGMEKLCDGTIFPVK